MAFNFLLFDMWLGTEMAYGLYFLDKLENLKSAYQNNKYTIFNTISFLTPVIFAEMVWSGEINSFFVLLVMSWDNNNL